MRFLHGLGLSFGQERLELEKKFTRWNKAKIQNNWRKIMRLAKVGALRCMNRHSITLFRWKNCARTSRSSLRITSATWIARTPLFRYMQSTVNRYDVDATLIADA